MVRAGRIQEVSQYCESDVLNTYRLWLIYELFRATIIPDQHKFSETQAREFIETRKSENRHLLEAIGLGTEDASSSKGQPPAGGGEPGSGSDSGQESQSHHSSACA